MNSSIFTAARTTHSYYLRTVEDMAQGALESLLELAAQSNGEFTEDEALDIADENYYEALVGFGSPLDATEGVGDEDEIALAMLSFSPNRHAAMTDERVKRFVRNEPEGPAHLFAAREGECIDFRFLAAIALHTDIMARVREKLARVRAERAYEEKINRVAVPFE